MTLRYCHVDSWVPDVWIVMAICLILNICSRARKNRLIDEESGRQKDKLGWPPQNFDGRDLGQSSKAAIVSAFLCRWMCWTSTGRDSVRSDLVWLFRGRGWGIYSVCVWVLRRTLLCCAVLCLPFVGTALGPWTQGPIHSALTNLFGAENKRLQKVDQ